MKITVAKITNYLPIPSTKFNEVFLAERLRVIEM
jgi:hypothetical protein